MMFTLRKAIFTGLLLAGFFSPAVAGQLFGDSGHNGARKMIRTIDDGYMVGEI